MKYLLLVGVTLVVVCQVVHSAPTTDDDELDSLLAELKDALIKRKLERVEEREHDSHRRELVEKARKLTEAEIQEQRRRSKNKGVNAARSKIRKFLSTNARIQEVSLAARTQLNVIDAYKREWEKKRGSHDTDADFWQELDEEFEGHILKARTVVPSLTSVTPGAEICPITPPTCTNSQERTYDGTCNNLQNPLWGGANRAQTRLLPSKYADGVGAPRKAVSGNALPSARKVANEITEIRERNSPRNTYMSMQFGQFLDHDITHTPESALTNAAGAVIDIDCGTNNCGGNTSYCFGIEIPADDPRFTPGTCMYFVRSEPFLRDNCAIGPRAQANSITAWMDMSNVYSSSLTESDQLVDRTTGKMVLTANPSSTAANPLKSMLPTVSNAESHCTAPVAAHKCFHAGDVRANEQVGLTAMHTVFARMHNHIVDKLSAQDSSLDADQLFRMTRRILTGLWQHMVYKDYLPVILGNQVMQRYQLNPLNNGQFSGYDPTVSGDIFTAFSTAAFRFGHTEVKDMMTFNNVILNSPEQKELSSIQFDPTVMYTSPVPNTSGVDAVMLGLTSVAVGDWDRFFSSQIRNHLFATNPPNGDGFDLAARNIQRGRDHGLPGYLDYRVKCGIDAVKITTFSQLREVFPTNPNDPTRDIYRKFEALYETPDDIDLYAGGIAELNAPGARVGPTFACIMALQFRNLKFGDRFYYENAHADGFTQDELQEIRRFSLSRLLCDTMDSGAQLNIQPRAMVLELDQNDVPIQLGGGQTNTRVPCSRINDMDYSKFLPLAPSPTPAPPTANPTPLPTTRRPPPPSTSRPPPPPSTTRPPPPPSTTRPPPPPSTTRPPPPPNNPRPNRPKGKK